MASSSPQPIAGSTPPSTETSTPAPVTHISRSAIALLEHSLYLVHFDRHATASLYLDTILALALYNGNAAFPNNTEDAAQEPEEQFFCYTETEDEISLTVCEHGLEQLQKKRQLLVDSGLEDIEDLNYQGSFRALQIFEGEDAINATGYIRLLSNPLAEAGISMVYLSIYSSDLILVEECDAQRALECLQRSLPDATLTAEMVKSSSFSFSSLSSRPAPSTSSMLVQSLKPTITLLKFTTKDISALAHKIVQLFLIWATEQRFFSFSIVGEEVSLILDQNIALAFFAVERDTVSIHQSTWNCVRVSEGSHGFTGNCAVGLIAELLAHVSIYYLSTFECDYTLVRADQLEFALRTLESGCEELSVDIVVDHGAE